MLTRAEHFSRTRSVHNNLLRKRETSSPTLQMRKQRPRGVRERSCDHRARKPQGHIRTSQSSPRHCPITTADAPWEATSDRPSHGTNFSRSCWRGSTRTGLCTHWAMQRDGQGRELCPQSLSASWLHHSLDRELGQVANRRRSQPPTCKTQRMTVPALEGRSDD